MGTITKALNLLNYFSETRAELSLVEFKKLTRQDKATIHRHLTELERNGFLEQDHDTRKYRLGGALLRLAAVREQTFPIKKILQKRVHELSEKLGELVHASLFLGDNPSPIGHHDAGYGGTRVYFDPSELMPIHATASGYIMLAFGNPKLSETISEKPLARFTDHTITDPATLASILEQTRKTGHAYADQTFEAEVCAVAVPFYGREEPAMGSLAVAVPKTRMNDSSKALFLRELAQTANKLSSDLGGQIPSNLKNLWQTAA